jgi:formate/nitrite transporter FocA (FNT family)
MSSAEPARTSDPELEPHEREDALDRSSPAPGVIHEAIRNEGEGQLRQPPGALAWSGLAAGISMGLSLITEGLLQSHLPETSWRPLVSRLGYTVGFVVVIMARQQLFTENTLIPILPLLVRKDRWTFARVARLWSIVLVSNLVGALAIAASIAHLRVFEPEVTTAFEEISRTAMRGGAPEHFVQGIFAGWLIALTVWMLPAARESRVTVIVITTYLIALGELTHVIAGGVEVFYLAVLGLTSPAAATEWILTTLAGNVLGGLALTTAINHAQVFSGRERRRTAAAT